MTRSNIVDNTSGERHSHNQTSSVVSNPAQKPVPPPRPAKEVGVYLVCTIFRFMNAELNL